VTGSRKQDTSNLRSRVLNVGLSGTTISPQQAIDVEGDYILAGN
jgi:hypothetical protein